MQLFANTQSDVASRARLVLGLLIAGLFSAIGIGANLPVEETANRAPPHWVRTKDGWERTEWFLRPEPVQANLHPTILAAFIAMASCLSLLAFAEPPPNHCASTNHSMATKAAKRSASRANGVAS